MPDQYQQHDRDNAEAYQNTLNRGLGAMAGQAAAPPPVSPIENHLMELDDIIRQIQHAIHINLETLSKLRGHEPTQDEYEKVSEPDTTLDRMQFRSVNLQSLAKNVESQAEEFRSLI